MIAQLLISASLSLGTPGDVTMFRPGVSSVPAAPFADSTKIRERELRAAIDSGIAMLSADDCLTFLKRFISPDQIEDVRKAGGVEDLVEPFRAGKAKALLGVLKSIRKGRPSYDSTGMRATFKLPKKAPGHGTIEFERIDGVWYIRN